MKNHTRINKLLTVLLLLCVLFVCMAGTAMAEGDVASVTINGETTYYTSIKDAVAKANESGYATITLLQDTTTKERLDITNSVTLDLNGNTLSCATYFADDYDTMVAVTTNGAKLTIIDSVGGGKLDGTGTDYALMLGEPGAYTARSASAYIDGSTVSGSVKTVSGTSMTVSGSTVESNSVVATIDMTNETTLNVFNSQILNTHSSSAASAIDNIGTLTITDSTISGSIGVDNRGTANISGNTNITGTVCSVKSRVESQDSTLTITGGNYTGGINITGGTATISGGSYTGGIVVSGGTATISDGTITESRSNKENAVEVSGSADLTISGGTFSAIAGETYDTGVYVHDGGTVKIIGGTITSTAYGVYNDGGSATITGGSISGGTVDLQVVGSDSILNLTLDEGKTVGAAFPDGITVEGSTLAELLSTDTAAYWGVVDGKDTMLTVADDAATGITDKGDITIRAICDHKDDKLDYITTETTHTPVCSVCNWTGAATEHTLDVTTGKCVCGADMTVVATVTDGTNTYYAADAATLNQAVTAILETDSRTFTVELPADAEAGMITAIRRAICDTEGVADGSIHLTLKGVTSIPGTTNWDGVAFGPGDIYDEAGKIVDQELVTQLASINLPDVTEIGAQAFYFCENLVSVSAPKAQTIGAQALGYTALTSVEFPELTTIPTDMFSGTWTLSSAKFPKVTTIEQGGLLVGGKFTPENNPTPFPLELTAEGDITFNGSYHFNIAERNYTGKVDLVLCCDKKDAVTFHDDGTATWQVREDLSYTFKSITFKHSYVDGKCEDCGEDCAHTGGTATCTTLAVCENCGASYGEVGGHSPNAAGYTDNADGTHSYTCSSCGNPFTESHTFTDGACTGCGVIGGYCGEEGNEQNVIWTYANGTLTISGTGAIADQRDNYDNRPWEEYVDQITTIVVNDGITSIGEAAFWRFQKLTTAKLPDSLTTISQQAFYGCTALKTVNFPANLKTIEGWAFLGCALESVTLPEGLTTIGYRAFSECKNLTSVTVPASVTTIDEGAFGYSPAKITVAEDNLNYSSDEHGVLFDKDKTTLIYCRPNIEIETYTIPSTVTEICKEAFYGCKNLATITIPDDVQKIGSSAFGGCEALTTITIPAGVTTIEANTFYDCTALTAVTIPAGVTTIDMWAFSGCTALTTVTIPASVTSIAYNAFSNCSALTTVNVPCTWDGSLYTFDEGVTVNKVHNWVGGACTVCGVSCDHTDSTHTAVTDKGDGTHSFECSVCGETGSEAHNYKTGTSAGACACGAACPHSNFDPATGNCKDCETSLAIAKIKTGETTIYYQTADDLRTAVLESVDDQTITLLADFEMNNDLDFNADGTENILDLNEYTLTGSSRIDVASGELTITGPGSINIFMTADNKGAKIVVGSGVTLNNSLRSVYGGVLDLTNATIPEAGLNVILYSDDSDPTTYNVSDVLLLPADYYFFVDGKAVYTYSGETEGTVLKHTDHSYTYTDNGDGTHKATCTACGKVEVDNEPHTIENHVCTACGAMEIVVSFNAGDYKWETGDQIRLHRWTGDFHDIYYFTAEVAEDGTVTWTPDKTLYWNGTDKHTLAISYPNMNLLYQNFGIPEDQSTLEKLREADCMNAIWSGNPTTDPITFDLKHRLAKVTVNYEVAEGVTISKAEVYTLTQYMFFDIYTLERKNVALEEGYDLWINSYLDGNQFTAFVSPDAYAADGNFIKITLSDGSVREVKMNKAVTFAEGAEYTYKVVITADGTYLTCADECSFEYTANEDGLTHSKVCTECGYVAASDNHTLTYIADEDANTITESCSANCGYSASLTLKAPANLVFDRTEKAATVEGEIIADYKLTYSADAVIMAGDYTATLTVGDYSVSLAFTIAKADPDVDTPTGLTATYGQILADVELPGGWAWKNSSASVGSVGSNTFAAIYTPANISNFNTLERDLTVVVAKAMPTVTAPVAADDLVYNGTEQALITAGTATGGTMQYSLDGSNWSETIPTGKDANTYTVYYKVVGDSNHIGTDPISLDVTITPKAVTELTFEGLNEVYAHTGEAIIPTFVVKDGETTLTEGTDYTADITNNTDVGTATITITLAGNYSGTVTKTFEIKTHVHEWNYSVSGETITATCTSTIGTCSDAAQSITLNAPDAVYSGNPVEAEVTPDGADLTYTLHYTGTDYASANAPTNAGSYTVTMTVGDKSVSATFTISPKDISVVQSIQFSLAQTSFVYSGEAPALNVTGVDSSVGNYTMQEGTDYSVGPVQVNAGSHKLTVTGKGNYTGSVELDYSIAAKPITITDAVVENVTFDPAGYTLTVKEVVFDGVIEGETLVMGENGDYAAVAELTSENAASDAATANVTVSLMNANYSLSETTVEATFQITQSGTAMTATADKNSYTYGETITVTGTVKATGTAPAATLTLRSAPAAQQVALFAADGTQLTDPVNVVEGAYTLTYNTTDKGILPAASITLTVKFVGDEDMADAAANVSIALTEKQLTATEATATTRAYESDNTTVSVTAVTLSGVIGTDDVKVDATNLTGEITSANAGTYTTVALADLTLIGSDKAFYTISDATVTTSVEITPKEITNPTIVLDASSFVYDGTEKKPAVTAVKDGDDLIDATEYTLSYANNIEMGTATVSLTDVAGGNYTVSGSTTFHITQSGTEMTATADKNSYTYGETITVTGTVKATGTAPAATLALRSAPAAQQVALFAADGTQLTDPMNVVDGAYTLTYNTADKGILPAASITLTVKFVGDDNMADQSASVTVALTAKSIGPVLAGSASKAYDGTTTVTDAGNLTINLNGVITGDSVSATAAGYVYTDETVGQSKTVTANGITLSGADSIFYTLAQTEASAQIGEIKKAMLIGLTEPADTTLDVYCADADAVIGKLPDTVVYHLADGKTVDLKVEWSCTAYDSTPGAINAFAWAVSDSEKLACYEIAQNVADDGTIIVTNSAFLPVTVTGTDTAITYNGTAYDVTQMFAIDSNVGAAVFEIIGGGTGEGTLNGSVLTITKAGTITIKVTTAPNAAYAAGEATAVLTINKGTPAVTVPTGLTAWYGQKLSDIALPTVDGGAWSWTDMNSTVGNSGVQTHQAIFTPADTNLWNITTHPVNITVVQAGTSFGEMKVYNGNAETTTFTYGETITVKAEATAVQPAVFSLRSLIAPAKHQMALFIRNADGSEVQISEAVNEQNGVYTMTYNTTGKALSIDDNALIAKFVGDENMADYQETVLVTLNPKKLTIASLTAQDRVYEPGNQQVAITGTEVSGKADANDDVSVLIDGMTATISSENVGTYDTALIPQDASLTGKHAGYYFARGNVSVSIPQGVEITQATPYTASGAPAQPVFDPIYQDGQTLGDIPVSLPAGTFNVPGAIEWEAPGDTPVTEGTPFTWVFTPDNPNWKPVTGTVVIYPEGEPPVITAPAGDQEVTVYEGEQGTMAIAAEDATSYQWYINRYDGLGYVPISGATSASYTTSVVNLGNNGFTYYCVASNAYGDAESPVFLLQVLEKVEVPDTGDESNIALWTALAILSFAGLTIITMNGRRSKNNPLT